MHFRKRSTAPIEPQSTSCSAGFLVGASTGAIVDLAKPCAYFGCRFRMSQLLAFGFVYSLFISGSAICSADQLKDLAEKAGIRILADGDSSASAEDEARAAIPLKSMTQENRQRAQQIIKDRSQYRRLPSLQYAIDEPMFRYLLNHPDVAVSTWRVMGISRFEMWQTGPHEYEAQAIDGSEGIADILYQDDNQMVFVCQGSYHNPLLPRPMQASALIWFRAVYTPNADGTHAVTQRADVFVRFPSNSVSAIAKVLTPVLHSLMDRNLFEVSLYGSMMSRAVRDEPEWVVQVAQQMEGVLPQRQGELIEVARKPRKTNGNARLNRAAMSAADRSLILSPQLQFLDPPKEFTAEVPPPAVAVAPASAGRPVSGSTVSQVPVRTVSNSTPGNLMILSSPGNSGKTEAATPARSSGSVSSRVQRSDDGFILQPVVVPPTGPTATGPVGSDSTGPK